uniref:Uncharacterized protein n=1 Tax=Leptobrachium leishanense TaxID=445787 RepID=A0A8C5PY62_9ANUR
MKYSDARQSKKYRDARQRMKYSDARQRVKYSDARQSKKYRDARQRMKYSDARRRMKYSDARQSVKYSDARQPLFDLNHIKNVRSERQSTSFGRLAFTAGLTLCRPGAASRSQSTAALINSYIARGVTPPRQGANSLILMNLKMNKRNI